MNNVCQVTASDKIYADLSPTLLSLAPSPAPVKAPGEATVKGARTTNPAGRD